MGVSDKENTGDGPGSGATETAISGPNRSFAFSIVFVTALIDSIGFGIILPVTPDLLMSVSGETLSSAAVYGGWLMLVFAGMQFFAMPVLGNLSDAFGRKPVLLISLAVLAGNYLLMGLAESLTLLFVGRLLSGVGSATFSTCNAYIADRTTSDERAQFFGLMGAAFGMGFVIGPVVGGFLGEFGPRVPFFVTAALIMVNLLLGLALLPESLPPNLRRPFQWRRANPLASLLAMREFRLAYVIIGVMFLYNMGHHVLPAVWNFWGMERFAWTPKEVGYSLGFVGILMVFSQGVVIRWAIPKFGHVYAGLIGLLCNILAFVGYAFAPSTAVVYAFLAVGALGGLAGPAINGLASIQVNERQQGELQGAIGSMVSLTSIISPLMMTMTFDHYSNANASVYFPGAPFLLAAGLTLVSLLLFLWVTRPTSNDETPS
ncbi:MAG: TCR/Tet family MFS transporter [Pseudomonadales bacterium]|jgi:DHA1 family tetracycline resistance protein-like MFS transporter